VWLPDYKNGFFLFFIQGRSGDAYQTIFLQSALINCILSNTPFNSVSCAYACGKKKHILKYG